jgi:hypothetical protein
MGNPKQNPKNLLVFNNIVTSSRKVNFEGSMAAE